MNLISELKAIQERHGYLPEDELRAFSQRTATPLYQIQAVASFYPHFRSRPSPRLEVKVCSDLSCYLAGARRLRQATEQRAATLTGCEVGAVSCLGRCDQAPAVAINDTIYAGLGGWLLGYVLGFGSLARVFLGLMLIGKGNMQSMVSFGFFQLGVTQAYLAWVAAATIAIVRFPKTRW